MMRKMAALLLLLAMAGCGCERHGPAATAAYDPRVAFAPLTLPDPATPTRAADGAPGPSYWQNRADTTIRARLDARTHRLFGDETIAYVNNSPSALDVLWLQLDQNAYRADSRARLASARPARHTTQGFVLEAVETDGARADTLVSDTRLQIRLAVPLAAHGGRIAIHIRYRYDIPDADSGGRTGYGKSRNGEIFDIAQWYPRMAVFDDLRGWDTLPYVGSEFYLEYGDFDYSVEVPADFVVAGSGALVNPDEVLTADERANLARAQASAATVMVRGPAALHNRAGAAGTRVWHFKMANTRDVSFSASPALLWDAARIDLPGGKHALAQSFYPVESMGRERWSRSTEYLKNAVENFSRRWLPYPWPNATNVGGPVGGMEYPAILFDDMTDKGKTLFFVTAHEIGHSWFPMIVGSNERRDPWMDEGFNTFIDIFESMEFSHAVYGPKRDGEYAPQGGYPADAIAPLLADPRAPVVMTAGDAVPGAYRHPVSYFKPAFGLVLLRERILGPARFDRAFRKFIRDWAWRHPSPSDFFRAMASEGGEDLDWFWRGWFMNNWTHDLAVIAVDGAAVTIENRGRLVLPAAVEAHLAGGRIQRLEIPVETWMRNTRFVLRFDAKVERVVIDPRHELPDADRSNNFSPAAR